MDNNEIKWPGWETVKLIGRGSFGAVYEIQRNVFDDVERAALKVISIPQNASDIDEMYSDGYDEESITSTFQSHLKSIVAEYSLMRKMNGSANIVNCDDIRYVQHDDGIGWDIFIKMELLTPLTKALPADIPEETVMKIAADMCAALELCKKNEIVHRDIKPQNIFVSPNGDYKLGDFGIAKTVEKTMGGTKIGTYKYMAPEVYNNQPYGSGADIYSLGLVLYWLLNERRMPFLPLPPAKLSAGMEDAARQRRFSGETLPAPKNGSDKLKSIVMKACAYDPKERYQSAKEMLADLQSIREKNVIPVGAVATEKVSTNDVQKDVGQPMSVPVVQVDQEKTGVTPKKAVNDVPQAPPEVTEKKQKNKRLILLPVLGLLILLAVVALSLHFCGNSSSELPEETQSQQTNHTDATQQTLPETAIVINVVGMYEKDAKTLLERQGFAVKVTQDYSDTDAQGLVIRQDPANETEAPLGATVTITVSLGKEIKKHRVPDIVGKTEAEARKALENLNFRVETSYSASTSVAEGSVISQSVSQNTELAEGSLVVIEVCSGKPTVDLTDVVGKTQSAAKQALEAQGFKVTVKEEYSLTVSAGTVITQSPQAGSSQIVGGTVTITVSKGKQAVSVTLNANGGSVDKSSVTVYFGDTYKTLPVPTKKGHSFVGWFTAKSGGVQVTSSTKVNNASAHTLYARWTANSYTITFNANGGTTPTAQKTVTYGSTYGTLPTPIRDYYKFLGWYTAASGGTKVTGSATVSISNAQTLYAHWEQKPLSGWVLASSVPSGAQIVENKWTYTRTQTTESTSSSLSGWTQTGNYWRQTGSGSTNYASFPNGYDTNNTYYKNFAKSPYSAYDNGSTKREVSNSWAGYVYWHWMYSCNSNGTSQRAIYYKYGYGPDNQFLYKYFYAFTSTKGNYASDKYYCNSQNMTNYIVNDQKTSNAECGGATRWFRFDYYTSSYTDYEKVYQYKKVTNSESSTQVTAGGEISNVQHYVRYRAK